MPTLEIITCSVHDAIEAERGGASRLEVISHFEVGGLTPDIDLVREILSVVQIPVRVMIRETESHEVTGKAQRSRLISAAKTFAPLPVEGLVLGFLKGADLDIELIKEVITQAPQLKVTFHRAFEEVCDPLGALEMLKHFPQIDQILTSGGNFPWPERLKFLQSIQEIGGPEISPLIGGGLDLQAVRSICETSPLRDFHLGRPVRIPQSAEGAVDASRVREFAALVRAGQGHHQ